VENYNGGHDACAPGKSLARSRRGRNPGSWVLLLSGLPVRAQLTLATLQEALTKAVKVRKARHCASLYPGT